jgi:DNA-binding CsgD family transcriptional regulator
VTEVTRLGDDPRLWTNHLLDGIIELFDAKFAACAVAPLPASPTELVRADVSLQRGLNEAEARIWIEGYWAPGNAYRSELLRRCVSIQARFVTVRRRDVMSDSEWYGSDAFQKIHQPIGLDPQWESHLVVLNQGRVFGMAVHGRLGAPQFTIDERRQFRRLHLELARAWRQDLAAPAADDPDTERLAPRLRQILWLLCAGRSEKEIAHELQLSPRTVHNHVVRLHDHFHVHSRGELLAHVLRRAPVVQHRQVVLPDPAMNQFKPE